MCSRTSIALTTIVLFVYGPSALVQPCSADDRVPEGLSASDWSSIRAAYEANRHAAFADGVGYQARNPGQQWRTRFDGRGFLTTPDAGRHGDSTRRAAWSWGLELVSYGRDGAEQVFSNVTPASEGDRLGSLNRCDAVAPIISACGDRVEYDWSEALTEWYVNDQRGLEHGFTVAEATGNHRSPSGRFEPLQFTLAVRGDLCPQVSDNGRDVTFINSSGAAVVNYSGLTVFDADGVILPAWFLDVPLLQASSLKSQAFRIVIDDAHATYPLTIDPIAQQAYLKASNTGVGDVFGNSVAVSGDKIVVGAYQEASNATGVNGNQADNSAASSGAAYVFVRDGTGTWSQQAYLKASNTGLGDNFGWSVSISGDTVVVGALREDSNAAGVDGNQADNSASSSGAAYVFSRSGTTWSQQAYLKASNTEANELFGHTVAVSGDTAVVGAPNEDSNATGVNGNQTDNSAANSGATYVFVRDAGGVWSQQAYVKASNTDGNDGFGFSVALSGDTMVITAPGECGSTTGVNGNQADNNLCGSGAAYVLVRSGTNWSQQAYLKASNTGFDDFFGSSAAVSGDTIVVGAYPEDSNGTGVNGNQADNSAFDAGAAYVFFRDGGGSWSQQAYLKASNTNSGDEFGRSVAISGDTLLVGAYAEDSNATGINGNQADNSLFNPGAAYLFVRSGGIWNQQAYLKASNTGSSDNFGISVAVSGDTVVVGAQSESSNATGVNGDQGNNFASTSGAAYVITGVGCPTVGNMNCDCAVDELDVEPFVLALIDPAGYAAMYPLCDINRGDMQPDGSVDGGDAQGFVDLLIP